MKKHTRKKQQSGFTFIHAFLILAFVAGITFLSLSLLFPTQKKSTDNGPLDTIPTKTEKVSDGGSEDVGMGGNDEPVENPDKTPKQNEDEQKTDSKKLDISITKNEVVNDKYLLRVNIYEALKESGTCTLEMKSSNGDYIQRTANVIEAGADYASCEGFDIPTVGIASGNYIFTIKVEIGKRSNSLTGSIKI